MILSGQLKLTVLLISYSRTSCISLVMSLIVDINYMRLFRGIITYGNTATESDDN